MILRICYCERCDETKYPKELIKWKGECSKCKGDTARIALFDPEDGVKSLLKEIK